jgi:glutamate synthase (NADPH/NADH) small chain
MTKEFIGDKNKNLTGIKTVVVDWKKDGDRRKMIEIEGSEKVWPCELALLALGFTGPEQDLFSSLNIDLDQTLKPVTENYKTTNPKVYAAGDLRRGQSLIVWAISEGREAAYHIDKQLMGNTNLPSKIDGDLPSVK